jgi:hypothetical protein
MEEMNSVKWLLNVLDELKPDYLIGAGDAGEATTADGFSEILTRARLITVNGNHENFTIIKNLSIRDEQVVRFGELRVSRINGLIGYDEDYGIPAGRFMRIVNKIKGVDILVTHQPPYIPELYPNMRDNEPAILMTQTLEQIRPRIQGNKASRVDNGDIERKSNENEKLPIEQQSVIKNQGALLFQCFYASTPQ